MGTNILPPFSVNMRLKLRIVSPVIGAWIFHYVILLIVPFESAQPLDSKVHLLNISFLVTMLSAYFFSFRNCVAREAVEDNKWERAKYFAASVLMACTLVAVASLIFDRIFIQEIDFSNGLGRARSEWIQKGELRLGVSSAFSVFGNLFFPMALPLILLLSLNRHLVSKNYSVLICFLGLLSIILVSALSGSRGYMFMSCFFFLCSSTVARAAGLWKQFSKKFFITAGLALAACLIYALLIILDRAEHSFMSAANYSRSVVEFVGGKATFEPEMVPSAESVPAKFYYALTGALAYISHADWTTNRAMQLPETPGIYSINNIMLLLKRARMISEVQSIPIAGFMISLPGVLWYDFGFPGALFISGVLGLTLSFFAKYSMRKPRSLGRHLCLVHCLALLTMAPFAYLFDFAVYPFCVITCLIVAFLFPENKAAAKIG